MAYSLDIIKKKKKFDFLLCLFCQEKDDGSFVKKPKQQSFTNILRASARRLDTVSSLLEKEEVKNACKWHRNCYCSYISETNILKVEKRVSKENENVSHTPTLSTSTFSKPETCSVVPEYDVQKCIFCQKKSKKGVYQLFRFCEHESARKLLFLSKKRQDQVLLRLSTCSDENDIFAANVYYHKLCRIEYFYEYEKQNEKFANQSDSNSLISEAFCRLLLEIDEELNSKCFEVSFLTKRLQKLVNNNDVEIDNRMTKRMLVDHYGESLLFSNPSDKSKSAIVFKTYIKPIELVERIRRMSETSVNFETLREEVKNQSFELDEFLCNESAVDQAFANFKLTPSWNSFFKKLIGNDRVMTEDLRTKCISIYMDLHYLISNGNLTPKHVSLAQCIHHFTRSRFLITLLSKLGHSVSYSTLSRIDDQVSTHIHKESCENIPLPSNIIPNSNLFVHGAIDNDDFNEETYDGKSTTHVTAMVLYQPVEQEEIQWPTTTTKIPIPKNTTKIINLMPCQNLKLCPPIIKPIEYYPKPLEISQVSNCNEDNFFWVMSRLNFNGDTGLQFILPESALSPGWTPFNQIVSNTDMPCTKIGFCPLFPAPPTTTDVVYTVMKNFLNLNDQLEQRFAVLSCDMAIYLLAKQVHIQCGEFERLFLRIGTFHLAKNWLSIIGQYLMDSGFVDIIIETDIYGENTVKSILRGTQYNRGIRLHKIMYETCRRLQLKRFFNEASQLEDFDRLKVLITSLQSATMQMEDDSSVIFEIMKEENYNIFERFTIFLTESSENNETFKYWNQYCELVEILLDCVKADRTGNWELHLSVVKRMIPYFITFNHYNYVRGCILYLDDMAKLPLDVEQAFKRGLFSVKRQHGKFNSVASDHALEQSLIRSSKIQGGLIGLTSNQSAMTKWCLLYHHKSEVSMALLRFCAMTQDSTGDVYNIHKEWSTQRIDKDEKDVQTLVRFFNNHDDPFSDSNLPLRNVVSGAIPSEETAYFLLQLKAKSNLKFEELRAERMVDKVKSLFSPLKKERVFYFTSEAAEKIKQRKSSKSIKEVNLNQTVLLANKRNISMEELASYELFSFPPSLALENGHLRKSTKSDLLNVIEKDCECARSLDYLQSLPNQMRIFDGMALVHNTPTAVISKMECFGDFANYQKEQIEKAINHIKTKRVDVIYDVYNNTSMKDVERDLRTSITSPININIHSASTKMPKQWPRFLNSTVNKRKLILFLSKYIIDNIKVPAGKILIMSGCFQDPTSCLSKDHEQTVKEINHLKSNQEEADTRMFLHALDGLKTTVTLNNLIVFSPDTDVLILGIRFWQQFKTLGCQSLWLVVGVGAKKRSLGCHIAAEMLGTKFCSALPALHALTGCDTTSKIATKRAAYNHAKKNNEALDTLFLLSQIPLTTETLQRFETFYLTLKNCKGASTCDESRYIQIITNPSALNDISKLSCTSDSYRLHVLRSAAQLYVWENSLTPIIEPLNLKEYGYYQQENGKLLPLLMTRPPIPPSLIPPCNCKNCSKKTCTCFSQRSACCSFCKCYGTCKNPLKKAALECEASEDNDV